MVSYLTFWIIFFGIIGLIFGIWLLYLTFKFLITGIDFFKKSTKKAELEIAVLESKYDFIKENSEINQKKLNIEER